MSLVVATGDLINVRLSFTNVATATALNVLHFRLGSITGTIPAINTFLTNVASAMEAKIANLWPPCASSQVKFVGVTATSVFPLPRSTGFSSILVTPLAGDVLGEAMPLQDSVTFLKRTNVGDRTGLGRFYFVGLAEEDQANGIISNDLRTRLNNLATGIGENLEVVGTNYTAILNACIVNGPEDNPRRITNVLQCVVSNNIIKTQRRRRPGKGI